jgi:hypothetical protein
MTDARLSNALLLIIAIILLIALFAGWNLNL